MYTHSCIKCKAQYSDDDPDDYYCAQCVEARKLLAQEIDAKLAVRPRKPQKSALQEYNEAVKVRGFMQVRL